jgi:hypothetical protein
MSGGGPAAAFLQGGGAVPASMAAANIAAAAAAGLFGAAGMQHGLGSMGGFESGQNAVSAENLLQQQQSASGSEGVDGGTASAGVSGSGLAGLTGMVSGFTSSEAVYGTDGLDVPGTAQVSRASWDLVDCNAMHLPADIQRSRDVCGCHLCCMLYAGELHCLLLTLLLSAAASAAAAAGGCAQRALHVVQC